MRVRTSTAQRRENPINRYLLCAVVSKQARRLGQLVPEMQIPELIGMALRNCTDHEVKIQMDSNTPDIIREEAARMFPPTKLCETDLASPPAPSDRSQTKNDALIISEAEREQDRSAEGWPNLSRTEADIHVSIGDGLHSPDSCRDLPNLPRKYSVSHANGTDRMRQLQLQALAENLYTLADTPEHREGGSELIARIRKDREVVFERLRSGDGTEDARLDKVQ